MLLGVFTKQTEVCIDFLIFLTHVHKCILRIPASRVEREYLKKSELKDLN